MLLRLAVGVTDGVACIISGGDMLTRATSVLERGRSGWTSSFGSCCDVERGVDACVMVGVVAAEWTR